MRSTIRGDIPGGIRFITRWLHALFPFFIRCVFLGGLSNDEILRPEGRIFLKLLDKDCDRFSHEGREMYAFRSFSY
jgi:hypothetical protein